MTDLQILNSIYYAEMFCQKNGVKSNYEACKKTNSLLMFIKIGDFNLYIEHFIEGDEIVLNLYKNKSQVYADSVKNIVDGLNEVDRHLSGFDKKYYSAAFA